MRVLISLAAPAQRWATPKPYSGSPRTVGAGVRVGVAGLARYDIPVGGVEETGADSGAEGPGKLARALSTDGQRAGTVEGATGLGGRVMWPLLLKGTWDVEAPSARIDVAAKRRSSFILSHYFARYGRNPCLRARDTVGGICLTALT